MAHPDEAYIWFELKDVLKSDLRSGLKSNVSLTLSRKQRKERTFLGDLLHSLLAT